MLTHESGKALVHINQDYNKKRNSRRRRGFSGTQAFHSVCFPHHFILVRELFSIYTLARHIPSNTGQSGISVDQTGFSWCCVNVCKCGGQTDFGCFPLSPFVCMWCVHTCGGWVDTVFLDHSPQAQVSLTQSLPSHLVELISLCQGSFLCLSWDGITGG